MSAGTMRMLVAQRKLDVVHRRLARGDLTASLDLGAPIANRGFALSIEEDIASNGQPDRQDTHDQDRSPHQLILQFPCLFGMHCINKAEANHLAETASIRLRENEQAVRHSADGLPDSPAMAPIRG